MKKVFDIITDYGISPNQYYLLYCISKGLEPENINLHLEMRNLLTKELLTTQNELTPFGINLILDVNSQFEIMSPTVQPTEVTLDNSERYIHMFPQMKLPSGKYARADKKNIQNAFKWFFKNYSYSWQTVFRATQLYLDDHESKGYKFMRTSLYFIKKTDQEKNTISDLANYCMLIDTGHTDLSQRVYFKDKVV